MKPENEKTKDESEWPSAESVVANLILEECEDDEWPDFSRVAIRRAAREFLGGR